MASITYPYNGSIDVENLIKDALDSAIWWRDQLEINDKPPELVGIAPPTNCRYCYSSSSSSSSSPKFDNILDDVKRVIYNDPATIVEFSDGSKVLVKTCDKDKFNKETGLIYAIVKRIYADCVDKENYMNSSGLGAKINKIIKTRSTDQHEIDRLRREKIREKKEKKLAREKAAKEAAEKKNNQPTENTQPQQ